MIRVGNKVKPNLEHCWVYRGTEKESKMCRDRLGTIIEVPWYAANHGHGTVKVRWNSLTEASNDNDGLWVMWVHTDLVEIVDV